jgi:hypothetical protein
MEVTRAAMLGIFPDGRSPMKFDQQKLPSE